MDMGGVLNTIVTHVRTEHMQADRDRDLGAALGPGFAIISEEKEMTLVQEFATYCEQNGMPSDEVGSAAFYANWLKIHTRRNLTTEEWNDLLDFVAPDVPPTVCPVAPHNPG